MRQRVNFADPDFEPTDEQLQQLIKEAFEGVNERRLAAMERLHEEIRRLSAEAISRITK